MDKKKSALRTESIKNINRGEKRIKNLFAGRTFTRFNVTHTNVYIL